MPPAIVTLKAFGDFVIACNIAKNLNASNNTDTVRIIAGEHVRELADVLGINPHVTFIGKQGSMKVPAIFNIKKSGFISTITNLIEMRYSLANVKTDSGLVFDSLGWRERLIGARHHDLFELPKDKGNIYLNYIEFYRKLGYGTNNLEKKERKIIKTALIIPGARMTHRVIPPKIINEVSSELLKRGINVTTILLDGESIDLPSSIYSRRIPQRFNALASEVINADLVITADSFPAHLCEYFKVHNFVFTPTPIWSSYWLPKSTFEANRMATFDSPSSFTPRLDDLILA